MRADLAPLLLNGLYLAAGFGVLLVAGAVRDLRSGVLAAGLAYMSGLAVVPLLQSWVLVAGLPATLAVVIGLCLLVLGVGTTLAIRRHGFRPLWAHQGASATRPRAERALCGLVGAALALGAVLGVLGVGSMLLVEWDAWSIWARKAVLLFDSATLPTPFFTSNLYEFMHPDYPLALPLLEANWFRAAGGSDTAGLHVQFWLLLVGFGAAAAWVVGRGARALAWLPVLSLVLLAPGVRNQLLTMYADIPLALFLGLGALLLGRWLQHGERADLALGTVMLVAVANTKNEGLTAVAAVMAALLVVSVARRGGPLRERLRGALAPVVAGAALVATVLPWRVWLAANGITGDLPVAKGLTPGYMLDRTERVRPALDGLVTQLSDQATWSLVVPVGLGVVIAGLFASALRAVAAFYMVAASLVFASLVWAYWMSPLEITYHIASSASRTVVAVVLLVGVGGLQLVALASRADAAADPVSDAAGREEPERRAPEPAGRSLVTAD